MIRNPSPPLCHPRLMHHGLTKAKVKPRVVGNDLGDHRIDHRGERAEGRSRHPALRCRSDGGRDAGPAVLAKTSGPSIQLSSSLTGCATFSVALEKIVQENFRLYELTAPYLGPRNFLSNWVALGADKTLLSVIRTGVRIPLTQMPPPNPRCPASPREVQAELENYVRLGVAKNLSSEEVQRTKCWVQTFGRPKPQSTAVRVITNLPPLNQCFGTQTFRCDH